jgi:predicted AlkP superfamily pyrophosphatase or phosphodiesterase
MIKHSRAKGIRNFNIGICACPLLVSICAFMAFSSARAADTPLKPSERTVVMISVDGLAADYMDDPKAEMPTIRALAAEGARASSMKAVTPTVTWPNHTTLVTGVMPARHGVVGNNYLDRKTGKHVVLISDPVYDKDQIVKAPTIYDLAKAAGLTTAAARWPASRNAKTLDWTFPDVRSVDLLEKYTTPTVLKEAEAAGIKLLNKDDKSATSDSPQPPDDICLQTFNLVLEKHRPNLALLHLVDVDHDQHLYGPRGAEAYAAIKKADQQVRQVWDLLKRDFPGKATLFIVSDHGFQLNKNAIFPNVVLRKAGLVEVTGKEITGGPVRVVAQGGTEFIYILDEKHRAEIAERVKKAFAPIEGVSRIIKSDEFDKIGVAKPENAPNAPDVILFCKEGYIFGDTAAGDLPFKAKPERKGSHGHDPSIPHLHATFVAWGADIKPGARLGEIQNTAVAPTIAKLLGFSIPNAEGKLLDKILNN